MREIKFRAWLKTEKTMLTWEDNYDEVIAAIPYDNGDEWTDQCNLMQYTGLKDKNGKEIYEGDIICLKKPRNSFHQKNQKYTVEYSIGKRFMDNDSLFHEGFTGFNFVKQFKGLSTVFNESEIEIIGNIYENANLLTATAEENK